MLIMVTDEGAHGERGRRRKSRDRRGKPRNCTSSATRYDLNLPRPVSPRSSAIVGLLALRRDAVPGSVISCGVYTSIPRMRRLSLAAHADEKSRCVGFQGHSNSRSKLRRQTVSL